MIGSCGRSFVAKRVGEELLDLHLVEKSLGAG